MNRSIHRTRACTVETLDEKLREAIRGHGTEYGLHDLEVDVLMCCETLSAWQQGGLHKGIRTTLSVVYVTPKWLVWADGSREHTAMAGTAQLKDIDMSDARSSAGYGISPEQGLSISGRHTHQDRRGATFIVLDSGMESRKFRRVLQKALLASRGSG